MQQLVFLLVGLLIIFLAELKPVIDVAFDLASLGLGLLLTLLLIAFVQSLHLIAAAAMTRLERTVVLTFRKLDIGLSFGTIVLLSIAAGVGEEILFRGALQNVFVPWVGPLGAVFLSALLFALCHAVSREWFIAAFMLGVIFGFALLVFNNLLALIIAHTLYDIWAFRRLSRIMGQQQTE